MNQPEVTEKILPKTNFTIGKEICHIDWEGTFTGTCIDAASLITACQCKKYLIPFTEFTHIILNG